MARHEREANAHESFNYALLDEEEAALLGCVYIDPPAEGDHEADADIWWWVVDEAVGTYLEQALEEFVFHWIGEAWPFSSPRFTDHDPARASPKASALDRHHTGTAHEPSVEAGAVHAKSALSRAILWPHRPDATCKAPRLEGSRG